MPCDELLMYSKVSKIILKSLFSIAQEIREVNLLVH